MVNASLNWASIVGIVLAVCGAGLYFLRSFKPALARDYDVFFAAIGLLCGGILFFQGWRLDPILQFGQFLLAGTTVFFAYESVRLRGIATDQARRSSYFDDEPELPRSPRGGLADGDSDRYYDRFEDSQPINRRFRGREEEYQEEFLNNEDYGRRPSRAAIPEQAVSRRRPSRNISSSESSSQGAERDRRMERFNKPESSSDRSSNFGDRRTSRQETRRGTRPLASGQTSSRRRNGASSSSEQSSSRLNTDNFNRSSSGYNRPSTSSTNNNIEDAAFTSAGKDGRRDSRRPTKNTNSNTFNKRSSSKSSYSSSTRKSRPRDNSSRFDD